MVALIDEIISYLADKNPKVRQMALAHLLGFTKKESEFYGYISSSQSGAIKKLKILCLDDLAIAHDALKALINLSVEPENCNQLVDEEFIFILVKFIMHPKCIFADLCCMLLCNLSKSPKCSIILSQSEDDRQFGTFLDILIEIFGRGPAFNPKANFDFLAPVFANLALLQVGRKYLLDESRGFPLKKLIIFTEHASIIRRGGVINTLKNAVMDVSKHDLFLNDEILVKILIPLAGPEELSEDDMDGMLDDLQMLEDTKTRESDPKLRCALLETLLILTSSKRGRLLMQKRKVYPIIREMHLAETDDACDKVAHELVQMLLRDNDDANVDGNDAANEEEEILLVSKIKQESVEKDLKEAAGTWNSFDSLI